MEKHANTWFPGDAVVVPADKGTKTAGEKRGTLDSIDAGTEVAFVRYEDGTSGWIDLNKLEKAHG